MSNSIKLKKGLDVPIKGKADLFVCKTVSPSTVAVQPTDFKGLLPRLLVKEGDSVLAGSPVIADKKFPDILLCSPVSGKVKEIVRGEKRKLLAILIEPDGKNESIDFGVRNVGEMDADSVKAALLQGGVWPTLIQRPYGILANPEIRPKSIFVSAFSTAPLAADSEFCHADEIAAIQVAVTALSKLTDGGVHVGLKAGVDSALAKLAGVSFHTFEGKHPAGNVGVQISHISPIRKEETVWTVSLEGLAAIGKLFMTGKYDVRRKVAVTGPMVIQPSYVKAVPGIPMKELRAYYGNTDTEIRVISGDVLCGKSVGTDGYLGFFDNQVTIIAEGRDKEFFGWARPFRFNQFSSTHSYFSWLTPKRTFQMDTNLHGGPRAFVMSDKFYADVLPMDIFPLYLIKACIAGDIEQMEKFGIYEVLPEDLATCEFVDPSKNYIQEIIAHGIDVMLKEMA